MLLGYTRDLPVGSVLQAEISSVNSLVARRLQLACEVGGILESLMHIFGL